MTELRDRSEGFWSRALQAGFFGGLVSVLMWAGNFVVISLPQSKSLARLEAQQVRESAASTAKTEHENKQARKPVLQVSPVIRQSDSVQDIREISLELLLENKGDCDAIIHKIEASVDNGAAKGVAQQTLTDTQAYYFDRLDFADKQQNKQQNSQPYIPDTPTQSQAQPTAFPGLRNETSAVQQAGGAMNEFFCGQLPFHANCPHGRLFALSPKSPDIEWTPVPNSSQKWENKQALRPTQSTTHNFHYLLTEFPLQYNRQWLRFKVIVEYAGEEEPAKIERQQYDTLVSGLAMSDDELRFTKWGSSGDESAGMHVFRPAAPILSTKPTE